MANQTCNPSIITQALGITATGPRTVIVPADPIIWDEGTSYEYLTLVASTDFGQGYVSKRDVPSGTPLTNTDYWIPVASYNAQLAQLQEDMTSATSEIDSIKEFEKRFDYNVLDYGADPTGEASSSSAFNSAIAAANDNFADGTTPCVYVPAGKYLIDATVTVPATVKVVFYEGCTVNVTATVGFDCTYVGTKPSAYKEWFLPPVWIQGNGCIVYGSSVTDGRVAFRIGSTNNSTDPIYSVARTKISGFVFHDIGTAIDLVLNNTYILGFTDMYAEPCGTFINCLSTSGYGNSGEKFSIEDSTIAGCNAVIGGASVVKPTFKIINCSIDYNEQICTLTKANLTFTDCHIEGNGYHSETHPPRFTNDGFTTFDGCTFYENFMSGYYVDNSNAKVSFVNCHFVSIGGQPEISVPYAINSTYPVTYFGNNIDDIYSSALEIPASPSTSAFKYLANMAADVNITDADTFKTAVTTHKYPLIFNTNLSNSKINLTKAGGKIVLTPVSGSATIEFNLIVPSNGNCNVGGSIIGSGANVTSIAIGCASADFIQDGTVKYASGYSGGVQYGIKVQNNLSYVAGYRGLSGSNSFSVTLNITFTGPLTLDDILVFTF